MRISSGSFAALRDYRAISNQLLGRASAEASRPARLNAAAIVTLSGGANTAIEALADLVATRSFAALRPAAVPEAEPSAVDEAGRGLRERSTASAEAAEANAAAIGAILARQQSEAAGSPGAGQASEGTSSSPPSSSPSEPSPPASTPAGGTATTVTVGPVGVSVGSSPGTTSGTAGLAAYAAGLVKTASAPAGGLLDRIL